MGLFLLFSPLFSCPLLAQQPTLQPEQSEDPQRKSKSVFHRPSKDSPAEQLIFARALIKEGHYSRAAKELLAVVHTWHDSAEAPRAQLAYALLLEKQTKYMKAFEEYQYLVDNYPGRTNYSQILDHQFRIANLMMNRKRGRILVFPGFKAPEKARPLFEQIVKNGPNWERAAEAQFYVGFIYENEKEYSLAVNAYEKILIRYSKDPFAPEAAFRRGHCLYADSQSSPRDESRCRKALSALTAFTQDSPQSVHLASAKECAAKLKERLTQMYYKRAAFYDEIAPRPRSALIAYTDFVKRFPNSRQAKQARKRIDTLKRTSGEKE